MSTVATLWVKLGLDSAGYQQGLSTAESKTSKFASSMSTKLLGIGQTMTKVGKTATIGLTLPIVAGMGLSVKAASSLAESINAVNVVFGDAADTIKNFGETAATAVGLSNREFNQLATVTGALLQNLGFAADDAADATLNLATRAADMASVFDKDVSQALEAVNSALKGEFNPLEQFGVKLSAADITARALAMGLADATGELDNNAKAQAALSIIMEQTDTIAGDFINTSDGLANSQRILGSQVEDLGAQIGEVLLPVVTEIVQWLSRLVVQFQGLSPQMQENIVIVLGLVAAAGPLLLIFGAIASAIGSLISVAAALGPVFAAVGAVIGVILSPIGLLVAAFVGLGVVIKTFGADALNTLKMIGGIIEGVLILAFRKLIEIWEKAVASATMLWEIGKAVAKFFGGAFISAINSVIGVIKGVIEWVKKLAAELAKIKLPDFMTSGSPTPWEIGLVGVGKAMRQLSSQQLPQLQAGLDIDVPGVGGIATPDSAESQFQNDQIDYERLAEVVAFTVAKEMG